MKKPYMHKKYSMSLYQKKYKCDPAVKEVEDVDITSLLDILVILLVFLLKSYNASDLRVDLIKDLTPATSDARELGGHSTIVQISATKDLYIDNKLISNLGSDPYMRKTRVVFKKIRRDERREIASRDDDSKVIRKRHLNIVMDKDLPFQHMNQIMKIASDYKYESFKFIVKGDY